MLHGFFMEPFRTRKHCIDCYGLAQQKHTIGANSCSVSVCESLKRSAVLIIALKVYDFFLNLEWETRDEKWDII